MNNKQFFTIILLLISFISNISANETYLDIDANKFEANEKKNLIIFTGDVKMNKLKDILECQKLKINTKMINNKQTPINYEATGKVSFTINTKDSLLKGRGDKVYYYPKLKQYIIIGNGYLKDTKEDKEIIAHKIYIDESTGNTRIDGAKNKPVKFRLKLGNN
jgi:lipopolysaccharide transport protein LptA